MAVFKESRVTTAVILSSNLGAGRMITLVDRDSFFLGFSHFLNFIITTPSISQYFHIINSINGASTVSPKDRRMFPL